MGRLLAIVIVLVAVALVVNSYLKKKEAPQEQGKPATGQKEEELVPPVEPKKEPSGEPQEEPKEEVPEQPKEEPKEEPAAEPKEEPVAEPETILLGSGDLLTGIPGEGDLTVEQIDAWLADAKNHVTLKPELPLGLAAGAGEIQGIDENPMTRAKIELGRQLYFDTRLSSDNTVSCASCHDPEFGYAKDTQFGVGVDGQEGGRNSPVAYNRIVSGPQFWDGRADTLEAQAVGPIENPIEMGNTKDVAIKTVSDIEGYKKQFEAVFDDGVTFENIGRAIATFERAVVTGPAPWDYYQELATFEKAYADDIEDLDELKKEDEELYNDYMALKEASEAHPISESATRGGDLFFSDKAGCTACHLGANFTDEKYHNLGVGMEAEKPDLGRFDKTEDDEDRGAFKTPTVRNISMTAPYMHDGSQKTLMEVVEWYAKGGHPNEHLSEKVKKLELTEQDKKDLVAFMAEGLLGEFPKVETERLPK
jgi:cytochrome c peroxidase